MVETRPGSAVSPTRRIGSYLATASRRGKAGGYPSRASPGSFVVKFVGSYTNVVGLPLTGVVSLLQGEGFPVSHLRLSEAEVETE